MKKSGHSQMKENRVFYTSKHPKRMANGSSLNREEMIQEIMEHHEERNNMVKRI